MKIRHILTEASQPSVLIVVHPVWIVDHFKQSDDYPQMEKYLDQVLRLIKSAANKGMFVVVTHMIHGEAQFDQSPDWDGPELQHPTDGVWPASNNTGNFVKIIDGDYWYFQDNEPLIPLVGVKNRKLIDIFTDEMWVLNDNPNFDFITNQHFDGGNDLIRSLSKIPPGTRVLIAGGNKDACVAQTVSNIKKHFPRIRLLTKHIY
jgi:nicotinamidase-related amidase